MESFVGQELLTYSEPYTDNSLYYWQRDVKGSEAEVDYLIPLKGKIIPVEVKGAKGRHLKSMHLFLESHSETPFGIRFSAHNYSEHQKIRSYPLYAIAFGIHWKKQKAQRSFEQDKGC